MNEVFFVHQIGPPRCPDILHQKPRYQDHQARDPGRTSSRRPPDRYAALGFRLEIHIHDHVGHQEAGNAEPGPRLHPPSGYNEEEGALHSPLVAGVGNDDHGHVDGVALLVNGVDDPKRLGREGRTSRLYRIVVSSPKQVEDRVEVCQRVGYKVGYGERRIAGLDFVLKDIVEVSLGEGELDNGKCYCHRNPQRRTTAEDGSGNARSGRLPDEWYG